jgi:hypothetical protein
MRHRSAFASGALGLAVLSVALLASAGPAAAIGKGDTARELAIHAVAGVRVGESFDYAGWKGTADYGVVLVRSYNNMVLSFIKELDRDLAKHGDYGVVVCLIGGGKREEHAADALADAGLKHVTVALPDGGQGSRDAAGWGPPKDAETSVYLMHEGKVHTTFTAGSPLRDGVASKIVHNL